MPHAKNAADILWQSMNAAITSKEIQVMSEEMIQQMSNTEEPSFGSRRSLTAAMVNSTVTTADEAI